MCMFPHFSLSLSFLLLHPVGRVIIPNMQDVFTARDDVVCVHMKSTSGSVVVAQTATCEIYLITICPPTPNRLIINVLILQISGNETYFQSAEPEEQTASSHDLEEHLVPAGGPVQGSYNHLGIKSVRKKGCRASGIMHSRKTSAVTRLSAHRLNQTPLRQPAHAEAYIP